MAQLDPDVKFVEEEFGKEDAERVRALLKKQLAKELLEEKIKVSSSSENRLRVKVTNYEKGCGFCRGFFPFFGLGDSAVDGEVELNAAGGRRRLVVQKTGQASGTSQMGDQTKTNIDYFATVVVSHLTDKPDSE